MLTHLYIAAQTLDPEQPLLSLHLAVFSGKQPALLDATLTLFLYIHLLPVSFV